MSKKRRPIDVGDIGGDAGARDGEVQVRPEKDLSELTDVVAASDAATIQDRAARKRARRLAKAAASAVEAEEEEKAEQLVEETSKKKKRKNIQRLEVPDFTNGNVQGSQILQDNTNRDEYIASGVGLPKHTTTMEKQERKGGKRKFINIFEDNMNQDEYMAASVGLPTGKTTMEMQERQRGKRKVVKVLEEADQQKQIVRQDAELPLGTEEADRPRPKKKKIKMSTEDASDRAGQEDPAADASGEGKQLETPTSAENEAKTNTREVAETCPYHAAKVGAAGRTTVVDCDGCLKVCAARLPTSLDKAAIWRHFEKCGHISDIFVLTDWYSWKSKGVSFITFEDDQGVKAALALDGSDFHGNKIRVNLALDKDESTGGMRKGKGKGKISGGTGGKGKYCGDGASGGYAYGGGKGGKATSSSSSAAAPMAVQDVREPESGCPGVIVKGLAFAALEDDIRARFAECGKGPTGVRLMKDKRTGESKGKAFIDFDGDLQGSHAAMRMNGVFLKGRRMTVDYVRVRCGEEGCGGKE